MGGGWGEVLVWWVVEIGGVSERDGIHRQGLSRSRSSRCLSLLTPIPLLITKYENGQDKMD